MPQLTDRLADVVGCQVQAVIVVHDGTFMNSNERVPQALKATARFSRIPAALVPASMATDVTRGARAVERGQGAARRTPRARSSGLMIRMRVIADGAPTFAAASRSPVGALAEVADFSARPIGLDCQDDADGAKRRNDGVGGRVLTALRCVRGEHPEYAGRHGQPSDERE